MLIAALILTLLAIVLMFLSWIYGRQYRGEIVANALAGQIISAVKSIDDIDEKIRERIFAELFSAIIKILGIEMPEGSIAKIISRYIEKERK